MIAPLGYRRGLDGIRGVAIVLVLFYNLDCFFKVGGYYGVDLFFGLSGFLVTTLLYEAASKNSGGLFQEFLWRRARRLLPGLFVFLLVTGVSSVLLHTGAKSSQNVLQCLYAFFFVSNWAVIAGWVKPGAVSHLWSLCVEVHFYILWGWLCCRILRGTPNPLRRLLYSSCALAAACLLWRILECLSGSHWLRLYLGTDTRLDGLLIGAVAAILRILCTAGEARHRWYEILSGTYIATLAVAVISLQVAFSDVKGRYAYLAGLPLASASTCLLILHLLRGDVTWITSALTWGPLVSLGRLSYSLYLWHLPVGTLLSAERLARKGIGYPLAVLLQLSLCILVSALSYLFVERSFALRRPKNGG